MMNTNGLIAPKEITGHGDQSGIIFIVCRAYSRHGEYYHGNLLIVQYQHCIGRANAFNFGRRDYDDWAEHSERKAKELFGQFSKKWLGIPDMVLEYPADIDLVGMFNQAP